jgi:MOB kinase activator 1
MYVFAAKCSHHVDGVEPNEWVAVKMVDFFSELSVLCNAVSEFCTDSSCPTMRAGNCYEYFWAEPGAADGSLPIFVSAPKYMELLMSWLDGNLAQISSDPSRVTTSGFRTNAKIFCRRLFRVYAHLFCEHAFEIKSIEMHLKYSLSHFLIFMREFDLLVNNEEIQPILAVIRDLDIPSFVL